MPELHDLVRRAYPFAELSRELLDSVLDMLDGRYPSEEFAELRPRIVWDRVEDTIRARKGARQLAVTNAGTIPDRGLYGVHLPDGRRVGELDEEMVYEARPGQTFLLGASTWRIEEITRDRVIVTPAPGAPGAVPFWRGDGHRPPEGARRGDRRVLPRGRGPRPGRAGRRVRPRRAGGPQPLGLPARAARRHPRRALRPHAWSWSASATRSATGACACSRPSAAACTRPGRWRCRPASATSSASSPTRSGRTTASSSTFPTRTSRPASELVMVEPDEVEELVVRELSGSALFGARFRENAARALLLPRAYPGKRTPLWQQRLKAQSLLEVAKRYGQFPIVLETYRECLRDVLDLPGLEELLRGLHTRELSLVEVETQRASPFASSLLFDYVATYMYEGDTPNAERRAAALALDRDLLRELLGQEELRELIDPAALDEVEADLQRLSERTRAANADGLHDVLRAVGDLTVDEAQARCLEAVSAKRMLSELERQRRAARMRIGGEERWIASEDAGLYRDALGAVPPGGLARRLPRGRRGAARPAGAPLRPHSRAIHHRRGRGTLRRRPGSGAPRARAGGRLVRGELRPGGSEREWCDPDVLRRLRRASLATLRREVEPAEQRALARFLPAWQGVDAAPAVGRRCGSAARAAGAAPGAGAGPGGLGARRAPPPRGQLLAGLARPALRGRRARLGRRRLAGRGPRAGWPSTSATTPAGSARPTSRAIRPPTRSTRPSASASRGAPHSGPTCSRTCRTRSRWSSRRRSGTWSGPAR